MQIDDELRPLGPAPQHGSHGGAYDNQATVVRMAKARAERAVLLGYPSHAAYQVEIWTARTVAAGESIVPPVSGASAALTA